MDDCWCNFHHKFRSITNWTKSCWFFIDTSTREKNNIQNTKNQKDENEEDLNDTEEKLVENEEELTQTENEITDLEENLQNNENEQNLERQNGADPAELARLTKENERIKNQLAKAK